MRGFETPCEVAVWRILPAIRGEIAKIMVKDYGVSQKKAAEILGLSEAAVSLYLHGKRGGGVRFDKKMRRRLKKIAGDVVRRKSNKPLKKNMCSLCKMTMRSRR